MYDKDVEEMKEAKAKQAYDQERTRGGYASDGGTQGQTASLLSDDRILDELFKYHRPNPSQAIRYENLRAAAKAFAKVVCINTPAGADQASAISKIREAVMLANASVALNGLT
jgi:hypothetical protein